ncbi:MAG: MFS transporter [Beijerinckiaceae bacterium]
MNATQGDVIARRNALVLAIASGLAGANATVVFATGGIVGKSLAADAALATVPITTFYLGSALATLPVAFLSRSIGRRAVFMLGNLSGAFGGLLAALSIYLASFPLFCFATMLAGFYQAVVNSYRFAAADTATPGFRPKAISWVMTGGVAAAFIGPQLVIFTQHMMLPYLFAASFIGQAVVALLAMLATGRFEDQSAEERISGEQRPLRELLSQPKLIVAIGCSTAAQAMMNFVMTAAPVAMAMCGHSVTSSTLGIQWHVVAMFGPSFFTGSLIGRFGKERMIAAGMVILIAAAMVGVSGITVAHFWIALILLGLGWNFAFIGATAMVTDCHAPAERAKVQGATDFVVFSVTTLGSLVAGVVLAKVGWEAINWALPPIAVVCIAAALLVGRRRMPARA